MAEQRGGSSGDSIFLFVVDSFTFFTGSTFEKGSEKGRPVEKSGHEDSGRAFEGSGDREGFIIFFDHTLPPEDSGCKVRGEGYDLANEGLGGDRGRLRGDQFQDDEDSRPMEEEEGLEPDPRGVSGESGGDFVGGQAEPGPRGLGP